MFVLSLIGGWAGSAPAEAQLGGMFSILNPEGSRLFPQTLIYPRHPGKPDPRWRAFEWKFVERSVNQVRYKLYFYEGEEWSAWFTEPRIAEQVEYLSGIFRSEPRKPFSYFLFTSLREFQQANLFFVSEGVQGITSTEEATMAVPYWGDVREFDHVSLHEMVHQFQVQKIDELAVRAGLAGGASSAFPLWFIEGMAEYYSQHGLDAESRVYLRDLALYPDPKVSYEVPKLFDEGQMGFVHTYKVGQAKIAFLEKKFGKDVVQRILEKGAAVRDPGSMSFPSLVAREVKKSVDQLENEWRVYFDEEFRGRAGAFKQDLQSFSRVPKVGDTLDYYDVSASGNVLAYREVDALTGIARIRVLDRTRDEEPLEVATDNESDLLSLYFFQNPSLTVTDSWVAYAVATASGLELEARPLARDSDGKLKAGAPVRIRLHKHGFLVASSLAISPNGKDLAFVGLTDQGWSNIHVVPGFAEPSKEIRPLTQGAYAWRNLTWDEQGLLASSNRTPTSVFSPFRIDPGSGTLRRLSASGFDQWMPDARDGRLVLQGWSAGGPQAHRIDGGHETRITDVPTGLFHPRMRGDTLYALAFQGGRFRLLAIPKEALLSLAAGSSGGASDVEPWTPKIKKFAAEEIRDYRPFRGETTRLDGLFGFLGTGGVGGLFASMSDLVRDYQLSAGITAFGDIKTTSAEAFLSSQRGRSTWTGGIYRTVQSRLDGLFSVTDGVRTYLHDEYGAVGAVQYPMNTFSFVDLQFRVAGVNRFDYSDGVFVDRWQALNPGRELLLAPTVRVGYDRIVYEAYSGPLRGFGILGEAETAWFPERGGVSERFRLDVAQYLQLTGRMLLAFQGIAGAAFGDRFNTSFLISSDDFFRSYPFSDPRLFGDYFAATKVELRFPLGSQFGFPPLRGLVSYDIGTIAQREGGFGKAVSSAGTWGLSLNLPPLAITLMFSYPIRTAPGPTDGVVSHFTLRYLYL